MPKHALYYPEWHISDPVFLAESLLYWDRLGCMMPPEESRPTDMNPWHEDSDMKAALAEAHERFVSPVVPTEEQKQRAHKRIQLFAEKDAPEWCRPENLTPHHRQIFSATKFSMDTLTLLQERGWTAQHPDKNKPNLQVIFDAAADLLLGALADACGSNTMPPITDDPGSFTANCNLLLSELRFFDGGDIARQGYCGTSADRRCGLQISACQTSAAGPGR